MFKGNFLFVLLLKKGVCNEQSYLELSDSYLTNKQGGRGLLSRRQIGHSSGKKHQTTHVTDTRSHNFAIVQYPL